MRRAYNPPVWNKLPNTTRSNYPGGKSAYNKDFPLFVSYRTIKPAKPGASRKAKRAVSRRRKAAKAKYVAAGRVRRRTRRNPGRRVYVSHPGALFRKRRTSRKIASARNPALVAKVEKTFGKVPFVGKWAGSAAGASVFGLGGALSVYAIRWLLQMESIAEYEWAQWLNTRPHYGYMLGGALLGLVARMAVPGSSTTKRAAQIAVTSAGFGAGALLYLSSEEDLEGFKLAKAQEAAEAGEA